LEPSSAVVAAEHVLLIGAIVLFTGSVAGMLARRIGMPDIVLYLAAGVLLGPVLKVLQVPADSALNQLILVFGASYILFDGGASLRFAVLRQVWITLLLLATLGVVITALITAVAAHYFLGLPAIVALLLASTIAPTDPATLIPVFRQVKVRERLAQTVISESAANDATGAILTFAVLIVAMGGGEFSIAHSLGRLGYEALVGIAIGALAGYLASVFIAHERLGFLEEYLPLVTLMVVAGAYLQAGQVSASGFMAVFVAGVMLGNRQHFGFALGAAQASRLEDFILTTALIMRMFIFILLGTQVNFALLNQYLWGAIAVVAVFMLVARPVTVFICALPDRRARWTLRELIFMCWTRETGVIPCALAGILAGAGAPAADVIAAVIFTAVLVTIVVQATTTRWLARKLDLLEGAGQVSSRLRG
jgi:cell volume regulation protein A